MRTLDGLRADGVGAEGAAFAVEPEKEQKEDDVEAAGRAEDKAAAPEEEEEQEEEEKETSPLNCVVPFAGAGGRAFSILAQRAGE